jgi:hypothetical protein
VQRVLAVLALGGAIVLWLKRPRRAPQTTPAPERARVAGLPLPELRLASRVPLVLVPAALLAGGIFFLVIGAPRLLAAQPPAPPTQPIAFDHRIHTQVAGLDCAFCHRTANTGVTAGIPEVQLCMACHQTIGQGQPEIEKVRMAWNRQQAIDWQLVDRLPDHTRFSHAAHLQVGITCDTCHGDVGQMHQVVQVRSLKMADCVACHQQHSAPTECSTCHY